MSFRVDDDKLLENYKTIWTKTWKYWIKPVYDDRSTKTKIRTNDDKVYINFHSLNAPEDRGEYELFTIISIGSILAFENKYYLQVYLDNCS